MGELTPGPWRAAQINGTDNPWAIIGKGLHGDEIVAGYIRTEQDAHQAAAAPDLLAALKEIIAVDDYSTLSNDDAGHDDCVPFANEDLKNALKQARAAIARAEGRT